MNWRKMENPRQQLCSRVMRDQDHKTLTAMHDKSVVKKPDPPAASAASLATQEPSLRKKDWEKKSKKECFAKHNKEKARSIAAANI